jgi:hypothetical protein
MCKFAVFECYNSQLLRIVVGVFYIHITCNTHDANARHSPCIYTYLAMVSEPNSNQREAPLKNLDR